MSSSKIVDREVKTARTGSILDDYDDKVWIDDVWLDTTDPPWGDHVDVVAEPDGD